MPRSFAEAFARAYPRLQERFNAGDYEAAFVGLAPDVEWHLLARLPEAEVLRGKDRVLRFFTQVRSSARWELETLEILEVGPRCAVARQHGRGMGRTSQIVAEIEFFQVWEQRGDGLVGRIREFEDLESALRAAGGEPATLPALRPPGLHPLGGEEPGGTAPAGEDQQGDERSG